MWSIGLHMGEHLIEVSATDGNEWKDARAFGTAAALDQAFAKFLDENSISDIKTLNIGTDLPQRLFEKSHVSSCAVLMTSGFETSLEYAIPSPDVGLTVSPQRPRLPFERDYVFGVSERTRADGQIEKAVDNQELEFLATKLKMNDIENVAICFIHSTTNPSNEIAAANWLREQGFRVHVSSQMTGNDPDRYWSTIWSATVTPLFKERTDSIITVCGDRLTGDAQVMGWGSIRDGFPEKSMSLVPWAMTDHLARKFAQTSDLLFCGLEKWLFLPAGAERSQVWPSIYGNVSVDRCDIFSGLPQPLSQIGRGMVSEAALTSDVTGYDIGPVIFGRGLTPTLIDLLAFNKMLSHMNGFDDRISERGLRRLEETLTTYAKSLSDSSNRIQTAELVQESLNRAAWSLDIKLTYHRKSDQLILCGPTADAVGQLLKSSTGKISGERIGMEFLLSREIAGAAQ